MSPGSRCTVYSDTMGSWNRRQMCQKSSGLTESGLTVQCVSERAEDLAIAVATMAKESELKNLLRLYRRQCILC